MRSSVWSEHTGYRATEIIDIMKNGVLGAKKLHHSSHLIALHFLTSTVLLSTRFRWNSFKLLVFSLTELKNTEKQMKIQYESLNFSKKEI